MTTFDSTKSSLADLVPESLKRGGAEAPVPVRRAAGRPRNDLRSGYGSVSPRSCPPPAGISYACRVDSSVA